MELEGKVLMVTGTGSQIGIGRTIALGAVRRGARVFANDVVVEDLESTVRQVQEAGGEARGHAADVADQRAVEEPVAAAETAYGRIDILTSRCAGSASRATSPTSSSSWPPTPRATSPGRCCSWTGASTLGDLRHAFASLEPQ